MKDEISIKVNIEDRLYPLRINASEEESVRKAAKWINDRAQFYRENFSVQDKQDTLAMAALEFATDIMLRSDTKHKTETENEELINSISDMLRKNVSNSQV